MTAKAFANGVYSEAQFQECCVIHDIAAIKQKCGFVHLVVHALVVICLEAIPLCHDGNSMGFLSSNVRVLFHRDVIVKLAIGNLDVHMEVSTIRLFQGRQHCRKNLHQPFEAHRTHQNHELSAP